MIRAQSGIRLVLHSLLWSTLFLTGVACGWGFLAAPPTTTDSTASDSHEEVHDHESADGEEEPHVALTDEAVAGLGLKLGHPTIEDFRQSVVVPAVIGELPGKSNLSVSAPVSGVIESIRVLPGEALYSGQTLFRIRITDDLLMEAQAQLLDSLVRVDVIDGEAERLKPLIASGAVPAARSRELDYERRRLLAEQQTLLQKLGGLGLPQDVIRRVRDRRELATLVNVPTPDYVPGPKADSNESSGYSVEHLHVHPGTAIRRGAALCDVAWHEELYIEGQAYAEDMTLLQRVMDQQWMITVESDAHPGDAPELPISRIDNHFDGESQTIRFYLRLPNSVTHRTEERGRVYEQWKWRPGQRLHLELPQVVLAEQLTLPAEAVVNEGVNSWVFALFDHEHDEDLPWYRQSGGDHVPTGDTHSHSHGPDDEHWTELHPISVRILHRSTDRVVLAQDGELNPETTVALNQAVKLQLALKIEAAGSGGHHHDHDH